jgi:transcriptional regulator with GAF, ATPase, and Fis domain
VLGPGLQDLIDERLERDDRHGAKLALLALGHTQACLYPDTPKKVLDDASLAPRLARRLPRPRSAYLRVAMAAGRCHRALTAMSGGSAAMQRVRRETWAACFGESLYHALLLESVIRDQDVLVLGETGTGKESIAIAIQEGTPGPADGRPAARATLNAAAVPETLVESELFGHAKGAFTGAIAGRVGRIRSAAHGCFFLDEIGDLRSTAQVKLLRVMETDEVSPLGSEAVYDADVRYVCATHRDLAGMVRAGEFRHDLYQRVAGHVITLPPLRERPEDIVDIGLDFARGYLSEAHGELGLTRVRRWLESSEAQRHNWPGNVRELLNALRSVMLGLDPGIGKASAPIAEAPGAALPPALRDGTASLRQAGDWYARRVVARLNGNLSQAARILGVDRATLRRRVVGE